jgi:hypothetical protein
MLTPTRIAVLLCLMLTGCASLQQPRPVGEPSPLACYGAKRTREAWEELVRAYVDQVLRAQEEYSCQPPVPAPLAAASEACPAAATPAAAPR